VAERGPFSGDAENVIRWLTVGGVILGLASAGLLATVLARKPAWRFTPPAKWTLLVGFFLFPSITMLLGNTVGFHRTKQSCAECHTMDPWVKDMTDPASATLAARHFQNRWINEDQCYTCHTGYGLAGNVQAKVGGMSHVLHYYLTGVPETIKIKRPFPVGTCLHCHSEAASYLKIEQHVDAEMKPKILSGEMSCFECHAAPHPRPKK
jgi:nitrate/TMAO reductase-like tetraheme cytochrome c subunit